MGDDGTLLAEDDLAAVAALLERADAADDLGAFGRAVSEGLHELLPSISVSYNELNPMAQRAMAVIVPDPDEAWWTSYQPVFEAHMHEHPFVGDVPDPGRAVTWDDLVDDVDAFRATDLHRLFYRPLGIESQLLVRLPAPDGIVVGISVNRGAEGFDARDRRLLDVLRPHLVRSYRVVQLTEQRAGLDDVLADDGWTVVLADDDGRVVSTSTDEVAGLVRAGATLPEPLLSRFRAAVAPRAGGRGAARQPARLTWAAPVTEVAVSAVVLPSSVPPHVVHLRVGAMPATRLEALGLTGRQAAIAAQLATGATNAAIAAELGIAPATVKKHLEAIYRRLGVRSRTSAVVALARTALSPATSPDHVDGA